MRKEMIFRMQTTTESERSRAMKAAASIKGVESVTLAGEEKNLLLIIGVGLGLSHINTLSKKVGHAELIELRTSGFLSTVHATHDELRTELNNLERIISRAEEPRNLKLSLLRYITKNFSDELRIGHGGCGVVYKGVLPSGIMVAVKKLFDNHTIDDNMFHQEVTSTMTITHKNIVRCLGYCSHTEEKAVKIEGKIVLAQIRERLLCFEHIGNGSVENHLTDELRGLEWHTRYQIIKGCCEGLYHLHNENHIIHMDLKPANILLDDQMVPKITDFGLSRLDDKSRTMSTDRLISLGYCSPEYLHHGKMSAKSDIYSLGVVILELVTGSKEMPSISTVLRRWKHRWNKSAKDTHLGCKQVFKCLNLVQRCIARDPADRPNIWDIMGDLNKMDTTDEDISDDPECPEVEDMLRIEPLDILLPMELKKPIIYSLQLTNGTDDHFAFWISTTSLRPYNIDPIKDIVPPLSTRSVTITLQGLEKAPLHNQCKDKFNVKSTKVDCSLTAKDISEQLFDRVLNVVDKVNLTIVLDIPNGQPVMVHTRDQHDYHRMHTWRHIYADHISG